VPFSTAMDTSSPTQSLDLGRLLRMQAMVMQAAQTEATYQAGGALVLAYLRLRAELLKILEPEPLAELREEFARIAPHMEFAPPFSPLLAAETSAKLADAAHQAQTNLRVLQGWVQGLIDELTLEQRLRLEAEAKAAQANRPPTGFQKP
jgi:hypothetical protein